MTFRAVTSPLVGFWSFGLVTLVISGCSSGRHRPAAPESSVPGAGTPGTGGLAAGAGAGAFAGSGAAGQAGAAGFGAGTGGFAGAVGTTAGVGSGGVSGIGGVVAGTGSPPPPAGLQPVVDRITLRYNQPATQWESEALPVGNGRFGAMLFGGSSIARTQFNVDTLWTGDENPSGQYDMGTFGSYQAFGNLVVELTGATHTGGYQRELDLSRGLHTEHWKNTAGSEYRTETFASFPAQVLATRITVSGPTGISGSLRLEGTHNETPQALGPSANIPAAVRFSGALSNGLKYVAVAQVVPEGCQPQTQGARITFHGCQTLTIYLAADTNYAPVRASGWRGPDPQPRVDAWLSAAIGTGWDALRAAHVADHESLYGRVSVDFGTSAASVLSEPMDQRIRRYQPKRDPDLLEALFQYGRYLLMGSSRPGTMAANLQGVWNDSNMPAWHSDYHSNINLQMNYWLAEPANLSECHLPLFDLLDTTKDATRDATRAHFGANMPGFTYRTSHNIFGGQGWKWNIPASAWYAWHYWEHYSFTGDLQFLRERAWPYLKEVSEYWLHSLKQRPDGTLVVPNGWSPEHGPVQDGTTYDQSLVWGLFNSTAEAAAVLGLTADPIAGQVSSARDRLLKPKIGSWGQLQEWAVDRDIKGDAHRHTSHLVGVYPGRQINRVTTPALARAAEVSLRGRTETGDSRRSWVWPWRCALWSRLGTTECTRMLDNLIAHNLLSNAITTHPPLQLDGSYGVTGAVSEVLLQSHAGEVHLLPAVDFARWPQGHFMGLRARKALEVSAKWAGGRIFEAALSTRQPGPVTIRAPNPITRITSRAGMPVPFSAVDHNAVRFEAVAGELYALAFQ